MKLHPYLIIKLPEIYDNFIMEDFLKLKEDNLLFTNIKALILDCTKLKSIESTGGEIFLFKKEFNIDLVFVGLLKGGIGVLNLFSQDLLKENIVNFSDLSEAVEYLYQK